MKRYYGYTTFKRAHSCSVGRHLGAAFPARKAQWSPRNRPARERELPRRQAEPGPGAKVPGFQQPPMTVLLWTSIVPIPGKPVWGGEWALQHSAAQKRIPALKAMVCTLRVVFPKGIWKSIQCKTLRWHLKWAQNINNYSLCNFQLILNINFIK